jgi:nitrogen-specific signal transduction histidine kinase
MGVGLLEVLPLWIINLTLAGLVLARDPHNVSNQTFAGFVLMVVAWSLCVKMTVIYIAHPAGIWLGRLAFTTASFTGLFLIVFSQTFPDLDRLQLGKATRWLVGLGIMVSALTLTPVILQDVDLNDAGHLQTHYGSLYVLFGLFILMAFSHACWTLAKKWKVARGRNRLQMQYLWLGLGLFLAGGTTTNLIIPALTKSSRFSEYGPYFTLCFIGMTAHAIIRHRLLDIRLVVRTSVTYGVSLLITVGSLWGTVELAGQLVVLSGQLTPATLAIWVGTSSVIVFHPMRVTLQRFTDKYVYRDPYDYRQATQIISQKLSGLMRLESLCDCLTTFLLTTLKVEFVSMYMCGEDGVLQRCTSHIVNDDASAPDSVRLPEAIEVLAREGVPVMRDELRFRQSPYKAEQLTAAFEALGSVGIIPLTVENRVVAILSVGAKLSGDSFFPHDVDLLTTVEHQASVALRRAQLYEEVAWMQEYNESILRQMTSGVIVINANGLITVMNKVAAELIETTMESAVQQRVDEIFDTELSAPLLNTLTGSVVYTDHETSVLLSSGQTLSIVLSTSILHGPEERLAGAILVFYDQSRVKEIEAEKRRIERLASVGAFAGKIAHEIKNPLVAIKTLAELLPEQYDDAEFRDTFTRVALHEVDRIDELVQRLRSLRTATPLRIRPMHVTVPLDETVALLSGEFKKRGIEVTRQYHEPLAPILGDHDQLKQVFLNLCLNSVEAMGEGGKLHLSVSMAADDARRPGALMVQIADTGPGISEDYIANIFEPFVTSKADGSGLGLAICKGIVDWHRGTITASNALGTYGTIFTVKLPAAQGEDVDEVTSARYGLEPAAHSVPTSV